MDYKELDSLNKLKFGRTYEGYLDLLRLESNLYSGAMVGNFSTIQGVVKKYGLICGAVVETLNFNRGASGASVDDFLAIKEIHELLIEQKKKIEFYFSIE